jgi:hypothetical protein
MCEVLKGIRKDLETRSFFRPPAPRSVFPSFGARIMRVWFRIYFKSFVTVGLHQVLVLRMRPLQHFQHYNRHFKDAINRNLRVRAS